MTPQPLNLDARLALDHYEIDSEQSHITVAQERCKECASRPCLTVCPAQVYRWADDHIVVRYENCLECGTCQLACDQHGNSGLTWRNPTNGYGIQFRFG